MTGQGKSDSESQAGTGSSVRGSMRPGDGQVIAGFLLVRRFLLGYRNIGIGSLLISKFRSPHQLLVIRKGLRSVGNYQ